VVDETAPHVAAVAHGPAATANAAHVAAAEATSHVAATESATHSAATAVATATTTAAVGLSDGRDSARQADSDHQPQDQPGKCRKPGSYHGCIHLMCSPQCFTLLDPSSPGTHSCVRLRELVVPSFNSYARGAGLRAEITDR
jgi:hypothetical protein